MKSVSVQSTAGVTVTFVIMYNYVLFYMLMRREKSENSSSDLHASFSGSSGAPVSSFMKCVLCFHHPGFSFNSCIKLV
jgi:hypothetical protein